MDILRCSFASVCAWSPFRFSAMGKGRKKEALHIAKKLLVRLLTQCSRVGGEWLVRLTKSEKQRFTWGSGRSKIAPNRFACTSSVLLCAELRLPADNMAALSPVPLNSF